jgi:dolichyl-diphosphooligosaccharide--protein glycosyltransferase
MGKGTPKRNTKHQRKKPIRPQSSTSGKTLARNLAAHGRLLTVIALVVIYGVGFFARFEDYFQLRDHTEVFLFHNNPILATGDGYYYIRLARDLCEGKYQAVDAQRRFPDAPRRPSPPPLLSVLTCGLHKILDVSLDWIAVLLPVLIAPLLLLPVYALGRSLGGSRVMGLTAALVAVVSEYYVGRSRLGFFDTDCLIVTLTLTICYCVLRFARGVATARYAFGTAALVGFGLFLWWWDTATEVVAAICLAMFIVALVFFYRPSRREGVVFWVVMASLTFVFLMWRGFDTPIALVGSVLSRLAFVSGAETGPFPSTVGDVRELQVLGFGESAKLTAGHAIVFVLAWAGYVWLLIRLKKQALLLAVLTLLALLPSVFGNRFLIFQVPVIAMGVGFLAERLWQYRENWVPATFIVPLLALAPSALCFVQSTAKVYRSPMANSMEAIQAVMDNTPPNATLWSTWWHGYPILYYARRSVITDGGSLEGPRLVYQNLPLASSNDRLAANFMQFWIGNGTAGMERLYEAMNRDHAAALTLLRNVCATGPNATREMIADVLSSERLAEAEGLRSVDDWLAFFFPQRLPPIYLLLTQDLTKSGVWFERGTWDPARRRGQDVYYRPHYGVRQGDRSLRGQDGLQVDVGSGTVTEVGVDGRKQSYPLNLVLAFTGKSLERKEFTNANGLHFEWIPALGFGAVMSPTIAESVFNRRFIRHRVNRQYFRPVKANTPYFQIWEVKGDSVD